MKWSILNPFPALLNHELKGDVHVRLARVLVVPVVVPKVLFLFVAGTLNRHPFIHCEQVIHAPSKGRNAGRFDAGQC